MTGMQPTEAEALGYFETLSNWGRWGADDELGTLNLITPEKRIQAAGLVRQGLTVSLSRNLDPAVPDFLGRGSVLQRFMEFHGGDEDDPPSPRGGVREFIGIIPHGSNTHLDSLAHLSINGKCYNGNIPARTVTSTGGALKLDVSKVVHGIVTKGVLLDIARLRGKQWLEAGELVSSADLEEAEAAQGVRVEEGDVCLLYTGNFERIARDGVHPQRHQAGYGASCLPWFRARGVAMISADSTNDAMPSGYADPVLTNPIHNVGIVAMGLWLTDNMVLVDLARTCAEIGRWSFLFCLLPWRFVGSTSSPVNPVAVF